MRGVREATQAAPEATERPRDKTRQPRHSKNAAHAGEQVDQPQGTGSQTTETRHEHAAGHRRQDTQETIRAYHGALTTGP